MVMLILQMRRQGPEKLRVFLFFFLNSPSWDVAKLGVLNPVCFHLGAFGIASSLQPEFLTACLMLTFPKPLVFVLLGALYLWQEFGYPGNPVARMAAQL